MAANDFPDEESPQHVDRLNDARRLGALEASGLMDSLPEEAFDRAVRLATRITGAPVGLVSLVDGRRQFFKASLAPADALDTRETPLTHSFCQYVVTSDRPLGVQDARDHALLRDNLAITDLDVIAYLGVPVHAPGGETVGALCAIDSNPRAWSEGDLEALSDITTMLETEIALRRIDRERQLLVDELNHRIKNLFALASSIVRRSRDGHTEVGDFATTVETRLNALSQAHELIVPVGAGASAGPVSVDFARLISTILAPHYDPASMQVSVEGPPLELGGPGTTNLALVLHELATNAVKYGALSGPEGRLEITWDMDAERLHLNWTETGGVDRVAGLATEAGFGTKLIELCVESQLGGEVITRLETSGMSRQITVPVGMLHD